MANELNAGFTRDAGRAARRGQESREVGNLRRKA